MTQQITNKVDDVEFVFKEIKNLVVDSRNKVYSYVNVEMLNLYWNIGKIILEIQLGRKGLNMEIMF